VAFLRAGEHAAEHRWLGGRANYRASHVRFAPAHSLQHARTLTSPRLPAEVEDEYAAIARRSVEEQGKIDAQISIELEAIDERRFGRKADVLGPQVPMAFQELEGEPDAVRRRAKVRAPRYSYGRRLDGLRLVRKTRSGVITPAAL
jgi:hypothetical protein